MKITTDKVYYNGKEFIVVPEEELANWPLYPSEKSFSGDQWKYNNALQYYHEQIESILTKCYMLSEQHAMEALKATVFINVHEKQFYTLPEPREFEFTLIKEGEADGYFEERTAILLPKEETNPAPLGEENIGTFVYDFDKQTEKFIPPSLGESSEEQKQFIEHWAEMNYGGSTMSPYIKKVAANSFKAGMDYASSFPTSEPPEEQEELWIKLSDRIPEMTEQVMMYDDDNKRVPWEGNFEVHVLAWNDKKGTYKARLNKYTGWTEVSSKSISGVDSTPEFWQPLPKPPQKRLNTL